MTTLATVTLDLARILTDVAEGTATGGSTTTLVDTARSEAEDYFDFGTIWFLSGNNSGKSAVVTAWTLASPATTFTFAAQSGACAAGNLYAATTKDYPRHLLIQAVNKALQSIGEVPDTDITLTTVADQESYTLPTGVYDVRKVEIATATATPYDYQRNFHWYESESKLWFDTGHAPDSASYIIRLTYSAVHGELSTDTGTVSDYVHRERLKWEAAAHALRWRLQRTRSDEPDITRFLNEALAQAAVQAAKHPIVAIPRDPRFASW